MNKKILSMLLIFTLTFSLVLSACNSKEETVPEDTPLTFYILQNYSSHLVEVIEKYNKYCLIHGDYNDRVEVKYFENNAEMTEVLSVEMMSDGGPDIISLDCMLPYEKLAKSGSFADIDKIISDYGSELDFADYNKVVMDSGIVDGKRYFVPLFYSPNVWATNESKLERLGFTSDTFSYEALAEVLPQYQGELAFGFDDVEFFYYFIDSFVDLKNGTHDFDTEEFSKALDYITVLKNDCGFEGVENNVEAQEKACLLQPSFAMYFGFSPLNYASMQLNRNNGEDKITIVNNFSRDGEISAYVNMGFAINENCKQKDKVLTFIEYALGDRCQGYWCGELYDETSFFGTNYLDLPVKTSIYESALNKAYDYIGTLDEDSTIDEADVEILSVKNRALDEDFKPIVENIKTCSLYDFNRIIGTHYNHNVVYKLMNDYLDGNITKEVFIDRLCSATEIYMNE